MRPPARLAAPIESTAYFVVAEALTNVARYSGASHAAVDGWLVVTGEPGAGTTVHAEIACAQ